MKGCAFRLEYGPKWTLTAAYTYIEKRFYTFYSWLSAYTGAFHIRTLEVTYKADAVLFLEWTQHIQWNQVSNVQGIFMYVV